MANRAKGLLVRILGRIIDGPQCSCGHDVAVHGDSGQCLAAVYNHGVHSHWCPCVRGKKEKVNG